MSSGGFQSSQSDGNGRLDARTGVNLEAGRTYGIPTTGTSAHSFTLLHDTERDAFEAQVRALGPGTTLLVDPYDIPEAARTRVV